MLTQFIKRYYGPDTVVGAKLTLDGGEAVKTMKEFKQEIKSANEELLNTSARFGATSKEALAAAKRVAELKDNIADANETAKLFDPGNKFQVLGNAVRGLVGGFTALQGALALVGVEGDEVQKTLLKVQGALALTEGLNVVADVAKDFKRLGSVIVQTLGKSGLIGVAIVGVTALGLALAGVFTRKQSADVKAYNETLKDYNNAASQARAKVTEVKVAFEQARAGVINKDQALKIYNDTLGDAFGKTNDLNEAERLTVAKADSYIKITALKAQANALFAKAAEQTADALIAQDKIAKEGVVFDPFGVVSKQTKKNIEETIAGGKQIEALATSLLKQAGALSAASGVATGQPISATKTKSPSQARVEEAKEEGRIVAEIEDERLARTQSTNERLAELTVNLNDRLKISNKSMVDDYLEGQYQQRESARITAEYEEYVAQSRIVAAQNVGNALGALADLIGKQTAAGKALAIAQAVINTWVGVTEVLRAKSVLPEPLATISKIANITAIVASGLNAVKNIGKAQVPGASGGASGGGLQSAAPLRPQAPAATNTLLNQQQLNQIGNATVRAFVVESDVSGNQERIRRLNRAARL